MKPAIVVQTTGLHKRTGCWAETYGLLTPVVCIDPNIGEKKGARALVEHEMCHARERHRLVQVALVVAGFAVAALAAAIFASSPIVEGVVTHRTLGGVLLGLLGAALVGCFPFARREAEIRADAAALRATDAREFTAFLLLHHPPVSRWGRWVYGTSREERARRAVRLLQKGM